MWVEVSKREQERKHCPKSHFPTGVVELLSPMKCESPFSLPKPFMSQLTVSCAAPLNLRAPATVNVSCSLQCRAVSATSTCIERKRRRLQQFIFTVHFMGPTHLMIYFPHLLRHMGEHSSERRPWSSSGTSCWTARSTRSGRTSCCASSRRAHGQATVRRDTKELRWIGGRRA
jgi:hypothetical protein